MEYTKGEWKLVQPASRQIEVLGYTGMIATLRLNSLMTPQEIQANAHLIATAPKLYEGLKDALKEICKMCVRLNPQHKGCTSCEEMERSREPLLKAEGGK